MRYIRYSYWQKVLIYFLKKFSTIPHINNERHADVNLIAYYQTHNISIPEL